MEGFMASRRGRIGQGRQEIRGTKEQAPTIGVTTAEIMSAAAFERGLNDARNGKPFDWRVDCWAYERGRLFAHIAPLGMPLWVDGRLNPKAVALCDAAFNRKLML
jgi:hypothetical protein